MAAEEDPSSRASASSTTIHAVRRCLGGLSSTDCRSQGAVQSGKAAPCEQLWRVSSFSNGSCFCYRSAGSLQGAAVFCEIGEHDDNAL